MSRLKHHKRRTPAFMLSQETWAFVPSASSSLGNTTHSHYPKSLCLLALSFKRTIHGYGRMVRGVLYPSSMGASDNFSNLEGTSSVFYTRGHCFIGLPSQSSPSCSTVGHNFHIIAAPLLIACPSETRHHVKLNHPYFLLGCKLSAMFYLPRHILSCFEVLSRSSCVAHLFVSPEKLLRVHPKVV